MALNAPIPTINGSQTEFSKVWIRGNTGTATIPNVRMYSADGRCFHPIAAQLDVTVAHTAAATLYDRIQAAATAADATMTAARFGKWFRKHQIVGIISDAITGDNLLVNRAEDKGLTDTNPGDDGFSTPRAAGDFYAQITYPVGRVYKHGILPEDVSSSTLSATVNVSGEVETSQAWKTGAAITGALTNVNDVVQGDCAGMASLHIDCASITGGGPTIRVECFVGGGWVIAPFAVRTSASAAWTTSTSTTLSPATTRIWAQIVPGATRVRLLMTGGAVGPHVFTLTPSAQPWNPTPTITSGELIIRGQNSHDAAAVSGVVQMGAEARSTDGTPVQQGDATRLLSSLIGKQINLPYALPQQGWDYAAASGGITNTTPVAAQAAPGAGVRHYVTGIQIVNQSTTAVEVEIRSGTTALWRTEFDADNGATGISVAFNKPLRGGANEAINIYCSGSGKVFANVQGYSAAE